MRYSARRGRALQMRQDERFSERRFVLLMGDVLRRFPLLIGRRPHEPEHRDGFNVEVIQKDNGTALVDDRDIGAPVTI